MSYIPTDAALDEFYSKHRDTPGTEALAELGFTLQELATGAYGFAPSDVEAIEAAWLWPELGWSIARFVMRLKGGRRVLVVSDVGPSEEAEAASAKRPTVETLEELLAIANEFEVCVELTVEEVPPYSLRPEVDERIPGEWLLEIGALNEFIDLWRSAGAAVH